MWDICLERIQKHLDFEYVQIWPILHTSEGLVWPLFGNIKCLLHFLGIIFLFLERYLSLSMLYYLKSAQNLSDFEYSAVLHNPEGSIGNFFEIKHVKWHILEEFLGIFLILLIGICLKQILIPRNDQNLSILRPRSGSYAKYGLNGLKMEPLGLQTSKIPVFHSKFNQKAI